MAKKIYDFLPGHLKNSELETIFDTTLDRAFSSGKMEKTKAFVGRKEKGIFKSSDIYLSFPSTSYARDNYGLEPTFTNRDASDSVFYDDLLNATYNKGALTNDHRRLFNSTLNTVALPIDLDKFVNYSMYYWVSPGFDASIPGSNDKHYVTIEYSVGSWWSGSNSWYHYDDIKALITDANFTKISQALRPIIEFDKDIELSTTSVAVSTSGEIPTFKSYDSSNAYVKDINIFHYVIGANYITDTELGFKPKLKAGDYQSEFVFNIDLDESSTYKYNTDYKKLMVTSTFDYRNLRQEVGDKISVSEIELLQSPKNTNGQNQIDLYVNGDKQIGNHVYNSTTKKITLTEAVSGNIYVDYCTDTPVVFDGETVFQRLNPALEYNVDNTTYYNTEMTYSLVYEHCVRIIETVFELTGSANAANNYRATGTNSDKLRFADKGSVLIRNSIDIKEAYFALTREDYNPIKATEFLSGAYNGYKNKFLTTVQSIIDSTASGSKTDLQILEEAITTISLGKHKSVSIFRDSIMVNFGEANAHYQALDVSVINGATEQVMPTFTNSILNDKDITVILNNVIQRLNVDYTLSSGATEINFTTARSTGDVITVRHYSSIKETYVPPSATSLSIAPAYKPESITDSRYSPSVDFIRGHDGSLVPKYGTRIDDILLAFETLIFNNLTDNTGSKYNIIDSMNYGIYNSASNDYTNAEKKYIMYPFFKKWMMRNNIDNLNNDDFDATDYKTWNYRSKDENSAGHWRGQLIYTYGTDRPLQEPWKVLKYSQKPTGFDTWYGSANYTSSTWWNQLITQESLTIPNPVDGSGNLKIPKDLFFGGAIDSSEIALMDQAWEFGDNSPVELAWTRSSEFLFAEFVVMLLTKPFQVLYDYSTEMKNIIRYSNKNDGIDTDVVIADKANYSFKLGSKLGGFVNNFKLQTENNSLSNSRFTDLPADNFDLFVHAGVPNRSEFFSAIVLEKVSLDAKHPTYSFGDLSTYIKGDIVLNLNDGKYYKRKVSSLTTKETSPPSGTFFDYSGWTLVSQPKTNKFGFRVHGYDEINPTFYAMGWDKASGEKAFSTSGDKLTLQQWQPGEYYRMDSYILWNDTPYVCLANHTSTSIFDDNIKDWKPVTEWPRVNKVQAVGYKELANDTVKNYNYGDILESVDDVAHLIMGYEHYLKLVGWEFTDTSEFGDVIDWENLLYKFLEWQSEIHEIGDFITLTPLLTGGSFDANYGVASVTTETFKNYYRVIDSAGRLIPNSELEFRTDGSKLIFKSTVPIYGMKMDIRDIEHAFVVDRTDSYEDIIYDPHTHTRNLRMQVDCNRTIDWDGTMAVDGYIVNDNQLIPNFDTMIEDTRYYRDTLVDQSLSVINNLKSNHYGYTTRAYLTNHGVERESQLEFYKGFLSHKGTNSSINKIVNNNSNFENITHADIWAVKLSDYGHESNKFTMTKDITVSDMIKAPYLVDYADPTKQLLEVSGKKNIALKTTGYVDEADVNYITSTHESLVNLTDSTLYEGDVSWVQADIDRDWDVVRLSEVAEISYVGETSDNQLYIGTTNAIDGQFINKPIYLKISAAEISPTIGGYYLLSTNGTKTVNGSTVHEYLVFEEDFEPLIVEIDSTTTNSVFVPTNADSGVEAIGSVSNPVFASGESISIDGTTFTYAPSGTTSTGITILGTVANPIVSEGEQARFVVYNSGGTVENGTNTTVTFSGTVARTTGAFSSTQGDQITIDGTSLTVDYSSTDSISQTTTATRSSTLTTGNTVVIDSITKTVADLSVTGTVTSPVMTSTKPLTINGDTVTLTNGDDLAAIIIAINSGTTEVIASQTSNQLVLTTTVPQLTMTGGVLTDLGLSSTNSYTNSKLDQLRDELDTITNITATIDANNRMTIASSGSQMIISGTALSELGITAGTYLSNSNPTQASVVQQINALSILGVTAEVITGTIKITSTNHNLDIVEVTSGAMSRLGYATTTVAIDATDTIVSDLNTQVFSGATVSAVKSDRQVKITSTEKSIVTSNLSGDPLADMGITAGTYSNTVSSSPTALEFASQITAASDISVGVSSDGRMIFTNDTVQMTFSGTSTAMLTKIGLSLIYSNVTSSANFKAMIWKSIRHTIGVNGATLTEFNNSLGLNSASKLWIDEYDSSGWAVLNYDPVGGFTAHARQTKVIDTELTKRLIIQDGEQSIIHQIYDPLNLKLPGTIMSKLDYVMWTNPAKYDTTTSNDIWLDERLGEMWWDTDLARFYRYNDYGDANGNLNIDYVRKYWGGIVPSSTVIVKKWTKSRTLPTTTSTYNTKKYYDDNAGKIVTDYFYWAEDDDTSELKMLIDSGGPRNSFLPVSTSSVVISNNAKTYDSQTVTASLEYQQEKGLVSKHSDWEMLAQDSKSAIPSVFLDDLTNSISRVTILKSYATKLITSHLVDVNFAVVTPTDKYGNNFMSGLTTDNIVVTTNSGTVKASYLSIDGNNLKISKQHTMVVGDVLRVHSVEGTKNNWFTNTSKTHSNFASVINTMMSNKMLQTVYSKYAQYIDTDDIIFNLGNWYIDDSYKTINSFSYLSTTREFDMLEQYENGIKSFKLKLPTHDEYYFEHEGQLQLVHRTKSALNISFNTTAFPETGYDTYYNNAVGIQVHELMHLIRDYPTTSFINDIFFSMIKYLYTEKTYPSWLFKTSYFDLDLHNREMKQYAVYQRDSEEDVLEYVREAKPYHAKIREIKRINSTTDSMTATTTIDERLALTLDFGNNSRYLDTTLDGGKYGTTSTPTTVTNAGSFVTGKEYTIVSAGTTNFTLIGATDNVIGTVFTATNNGVETINAGSFVIGNAYYISAPGTTDFTLIGASDSNIGTTFTATGVGTGTGTAGWSGTGTAKTNSFGNIADGEYEQGQFLLNRFTQTAEEGGFDTGLVDSKALESSVVRLQTYTGDITGGIGSETVDKTQFYVYDMYGRGYNIGVKSSDTISSFNGTTLVVNNASLFSTASKNNKKLIAVQKAGTSNVEFMMYDKKASSSLTISDRVLYTGLGHSFANNDLVYVLETPLQLVLQDLV